MSFANFSLHPLVLKSLDVEGYVDPTPVQAAAIPPALEGRDILANAATGTGKTAAFVLPALTRLASNPKTCPAGAPRVLILAPTRELAAQVSQAVRKHGHFMRVTSADIVGGMPYRDQLRYLSRPLDVVVATPGRLIDHLHRGRLDLSRVEVLVLDEADRMLDMGFAEDVDTIAKVCSSDRQTMLFTATLDKRMAGVAAKLLRNPVRVAVDQATSSAAIEQRLYYTNHIGHKRRLLDHFAASTEVAKAIVFVATKRDADNLAQDLTRTGHRAAPLHGDMHQSERNRTLQHLRNGDVRLVVATDVAARGIDVRDITHVINFDLPRGPDDYVHRIAISFAGAADRNLIRHIERLTRTPITVHTVTGLEPGPMVNRPARPEFRSGRPNGRPGGRPSDGPSGNFRSAHPDMARPHPERANAERPNADRPRSDRLHTPNPWSKPRKAGNRDKGRPSWATAGGRQR
jgi:superfamily II DNA/RNA helicase